jgi:Spore germination protein.
LAGTDLVTILLPGLGISICISFLKRPASMKKITMYSLGMVLPLFLLNILGIVGTFGPTVMKKLSWPAVEYFHQIDFPFLLLEQAGLFFLIAWYASIFVTMGVGAFFVGNEFHIIFPRIKRQWITIAYCVILLIIVNLPISMIASEKFFKSTHKWIAFSFLSFFVIAWLVDRLRSKK